MISKKAVLLGGLSLLIGTASVAAAKEAICSEQIMPTVLTAQKRPDAKWHFMILLLSLNQTARKPSR